MTDLTLYFPIFEPIPSRFGNTHGPYSGIVGMTFAQRTLLDRVLAIVDRGVHSFAALLDRLAAFAVRSLSTGLDAAEQKRRAAVLEQAQNEIAGVLTISNLWGQMGVIRKAREAGVNMGGGGPTGPPPDELDTSDDSPVEIRVEINEGLDELPKIAFTEAIADLVAREPQLRRGWKAVAQAYASGPVFALAQSADIAITKRVQQHIASVLREGGTVEQAAARISEITGFSQAMSETVYRTNAATAFSAGINAQLKDSEVRYAFPALERSSVHDSSTRPNHAAADGLIASPDDPMMKLWMPPSGHRCRCTVRMVSRGELERKGLLRENGSVQPYYPPKIYGAAPDPGFGGGS